MPKGLFILGKDSYSKIYAPEQVEEIKRKVEILGPPLTADKALEHPDLLRDMEVMFSGWGAPKLDETFLDAAPNLKMVFYGAGSIRSMVTEAFWDRGIRVTSAYAANAVPVAEFCVSQIIFALKLGWQHTLQTIHDKQWQRHPHIPGAYNAKVGLITMGMIGQYTAERLKPLNIDVVAYSRSRNPQLAADLQLTYAELEDIFASCDVVSLHTPWLPQTENMIGADLLKRMKPNATFLNTARGAVVNEKELIEVMKDRPDLVAVLDVTHPEPPAADSELWTLRNVVLLPHIAGSMGKECHRMAEYMICELGHYLAGEQLDWEIDQEKAKTLA